MKKARLYYDGSCPVCANYVRLIMKKVNTRQIEFIPTHDNSKEFQFITAENVAYTGTKAIEMLAANFPEILNYFWMLPPKFKVKGVKAAYKVGGVLRKIIKKKNKKGCGCK